MEIGDICVAVVRIAKEALDLGEGLQDLALRRSGIFELSVVVCCGCDLLKSSGI